MSVIAWGLLVAFVVHDGEEFVTMPGWAVRHRRLLDVRAPFLPTVVRRRLEADGAGVRLAVVLMGVIVAVAAWRGLATDGHDLLFRAALAGYGAHAIGHLVASCVLRAYTPGVVTAVTVVLPGLAAAWWWTSLAGTPLGALDFGAGLVAAAGALAVAHGGASVILRAVRWAGQRTGGRAR